MRTRAVGTEQRHIIFYNIFLIYHIDIIYIIFNLNT
jgi:hypothetical protein